MSIMMTHSLADGDANWLALLIAIVSGVPGTEAMLRMGIAPKNKKSDDKPKGRKADTRYKWSEPNMRMAIDAARECGMSDAEIAIVFGEVKSV